MTKVNPRFATVDIVAVNGVPCREPFRGTIRSVCRNENVPASRSWLNHARVHDAHAHRVQDIRATEKDKVQVYRSFRPADVVLAEVISLGDARSYLLSTARNELGVIFAESEAGTFADNIKAGFGFADKGRVGVGVG